MESSKQVSSSSRARSPQIAASLLAADFGHLSDQVKAAEAAGVDLFHIDIMDGDFVPNLSMGPMVVERLRTLTELPLDVHLMVREPLRYLDVFKRAGANWLSVHWEALHDVPSGLQRMRSLNARVGLAFRPGTPVSAVEPLLSELDFVLMMTVEPGFGGQAFREDQIKKLSYLRQVVEKRGLGVEIEVDGGIGPSTAPMCGKYVDIFVAGTSIFRGDEALLPDRVGALRQAINRED